MSYNWDFFVRQASEPTPYSAPDCDNGDRDRRPLPRSQTGDVTGDYLVVDDPVFITPEILGMAWGRGDDECEVRGKENKEGSEGC
jgi:hypothetical protein